MSAAFAAVILAIVGIAISIIVCYGFARKTESVQFQNPPVVVTSTTHTAPGGYPVTQTVGPTAYQTQVYTAPYPTQQSTTGQVIVPMPMPMPATQPPVPGVQQHVAPYPAMPNMNPPPYDAAVGAGNITGQTFGGGYEKQSAYNPHFTTQ